jgi:ribosomal protein L34E
MPQLHFRTSSRKRQKVKSSGGSNITSYKNEKTATPSSLICGNPLAGLPHFTQTKIRKLSQSKKETTARTADRCATTALKTCRYSL